MNLRFSGESIQDSDYDVDERSQVRAVSAPSTSEAEGDQNGGFVLVSFNSELKKFNPIDLSQEFDVEKFQRSFVEAVEQARQVLSKEEIHDYMMKICTLFHLPTDLLQLNPEELGKAIVRNPYESTKPDLLNNDEVVEDESTDSQGDEEMDL